MGLIRFARWCCLLHLCEGREGGGGGEKEEEEEIWDQMKEISLKDSSFKDDYESIQFRLLSGLYHGEESMEALLEVNRQLEERRRLMMRDHGGYEASAGIGSSRNFDQYASASNQRGVEDGEESLVASELEHDFQHKRAKVQSDYVEMRYAGGGSSISKSLASSFPFGDEYIDSNAINGGSEDLMDTSGCTYEMEIDEVRMDLTDDLLHMVLSFLNHVDLCRAASVCTQWRAASAHEDFWRCLNFQDRNISERQFADMCLRYPSATEVNILGVPAIHLLALDAIETLRNLEILIVGKGQLSEIFFQNLGGCVTLKSLSITDAFLGNGIQEIPVCHDKLKILKIKKCKVLRISVRCPQLEVLSMKRTNMAHIALNCPQLQELDVGSCHKLSDAGIRAAVTSCPLLTSLDMSNCSCVTDETLREIASSCAHLRALDASYCPNISLESVRLPMLTVLKLDNCEGITTASMVAISHSDMLEVLELDNCGLLTSVSLNLQHLQNIRLIHCRKFVDLNLQCPMLSSITVSNCPSLNRINLASTSLQKLVLQRQESLTTLALRCQALQEVDLTECESLTNFVCDVFSDDGGCPILKSLVLDSCESLTEVRLHSTSLLSVSLISCRTMIALELACPYLEQVFLDGCDHLEKALFSPVGLRSLNLGICPRLAALQIEAPRMVVLELKGCGVLSEASIHCPRLTSLDASFCSQLTDDCLYATTSMCPLVESLILMTCQALSSNGLTSLGCLARLTSLDLSYTFLEDLQPVFDYCLQLKVLKLQACKYLTDSSLEPLYRKGVLPALRELDLSNLNLRQSAIEELLTCCTHLTHVSLNACANMHDLIWSTSTGHHSESGSDMPSLENVREQIDQPNRLLQNLNCVGCPNIKKVVIPVAARCVNLSLLNLNLSANIKEVDIVCMNLSVLNLSNCNALEYLRLGCPRLSNLNLQSCIIAEEELEAAVSHCSMLETLDVRFCPKIYPVSIGRLRAVCPSLKRIFTSL